MKHHEEYFPDSYKNNLGIHESTKKYWLHQPWKNE